MLNELIQSIKEDTQEHRREVLRELQERNNKGEWRHVGNIDKGQNTGASANDVGEPIG